MSPLAVKCRLCVCARHQCVYDVVRFRFTCIIIWYTQRPKNVNGASRSKRYGRKEKKRKKENTFWVGISSSVNDDNSRRRTNPRRSSRRKEETVPHDRKIYTLHIFARSIRSINFASHVLRNYQIHTHTHTDTTKRQNYRKVSLQAVNQWNVFFCCSSALLPFLFRFLHLKCVCVLGCKWVCVYGEHKEYSLVLCGKSVRKKTA